MENTTNAKIINEAINRYRQRTGNAPGPVKAALIDMDGTLYNSMPWHALAWHKMMDTQGVFTTVEEFFAYEGMTGRDTIRMLFERAGLPAPTDAQVKELYALKSALFRSDNHARVMPGAAEMVSTLRKNNIATILVTGSGQATLLSRLETDFPGAFPPEKRITAADVTHGKPAPEPYLKALELAGVDSTEALVIENAPLGALAGVRAGVFTVAVNTGPIPREQLAASGADLVMDSMPAMAKILPELLYTLNS